MNPLRPGLVLVLVIALGLAFGQASIAQTDPQYGDEAAPSASELYRDVKTLRLVAQLELTTTQIGKILPVVQGVADQAVADGKTDDEVWRRLMADSTTVVNTLTLGREPPEAETAALDEAARERNQRGNSRAALAADAAAQIQRMLTAVQSRRIETAAAQAQRLAYQERLQGARTPVEYIVQKLDEQGELMPDEYVRTRDQRALGMAEAILGNRAPGVQNLAVALLGIMDQVASWTPEEYARQRPTLSEQIAKTLNLPENTTVDLIRYEDFIAWITSAKTPPVLRELLAVRGPATTEEGVTP